MRAETQETVRRYGIVKWFGGHNNKTGRENNFGFIRDASNEDVFLHRGEWQDGKLPVQDEIVTYLEQVFDGKRAAHRAQRLQSAGLGAAELYEALCSALFLEIKPSASGSLILVQRAIQEELCQELRRAGHQEISLIIRKSQKPGMPSIFGFATGDPQIFATLLEVGGQSVATDDALWVALSLSTAIHLETQLAECTKDLSPQLLRDRCAGRLSILPPSLLTHFLTRNVFISTDELGSSTKRIYDYLSSVVIKGTSTFPGYLKNSFESDSDAHGGKPSNAILRDIIDNLHFKKSLFEKSGDFVDIYASSTRIQRNVETYILCNLFSLIVSGNRTEVVVRVFMQRLWESLTSKALPFEQQKAKLQILFPPCVEMGPKLSCEAVHWTKEDESRFYCRGKVCQSPQVLPVPDRHYLEFTIYDWLSHYGINYLASGKPQTKDFPIKLAGYFNRLQEILPILHCRECDNLMLPDMRYARTQYRELVNGVVVVKELAAAYRLTVFHCNNCECKEFNANYYINHCLGFGCHHIIDSRDLKRKCSQDRFICSSCGSCCSVHAIDKPAGLCAMCGDDLEVWDGNGHGPKVVRCKSLACGFRIGSYRLLAKFRNLHAKAG